MGTTYRAPADRVVLDASGAQVKFRAVVTADVTFEHRRRGTIVSALGIYEGNWAPTNTTAALAPGDK